jgi:hypothetical protein
MLFDITYSVPYEEGCVICGFSVEEVLAWLKETSYDNAASAYITPSNNPSFDRHQFVREFT